MLNQGDDAVRRLIYELGRRAYHLVFEPLGLSVPSRVLKLFGEKFGRKGEMEYWIELEKKHGSIPNSHYKHLMMASGGIDDLTWFANKVVVDIGCGPGGSLGWCTTARVRLGVDPLSENYARFGICNHDMVYLNVCAEDIPLPSHSVDVVYSINSLDHVRDVDVVIGEVRRILRPGGYFLGALNLFEEPNIREPHIFTPDSVEAFMAEGFTREWYKIGPHPIAVTSMSPELLPRLEPSDLLYGYSHMLDSAQPPPADTSKSHILFCRYRRV